MKDEKHEAKLIGKARKQDGEYIEITITAEKTVGISGQIFTLFEFDEYVELEYDLLYDETEMAIETAGLNYVVEINEKELMFIARDNALSMDILNINGMDYVMDIFASGRIEELEDDNLLKHIFGKRTAEIISEILMMSLSHKTEDMNRARELIAELNKMIEGGELARSYEEII